MIKRELYMSRIRPFIGTELVKVMTGIRRCGKSVMLELIQQELAESGVSRAQFISINFEDMSYSHLQTAQALGGEIEIVPALGDYDIGDWQGQRLSDLQQSMPQALANWISNPDAAPHGGESIQALCLRVSAWLDEFREEGHFAVVTHPFVIRAAILHALAASTASFNLIDVEPLAVVDLRFNERWRLRV